ncbi:Hypothetical protein PENO1_067420 [Penicillium occitanis (nom. inval.)]|nr:hypothetical protein PENOC_090640 [Penicillium occitanis (nom. inval.)]PCG96643.1 Hypothetical protein PENO1_067420 [Penicillium occitanis (nom. inval.)]
MSGVVVLANAYRLSDVPDWIAQWVIETLFEEDTNTRYLQLAEETVSAYRAWYAKTVKDLTDLKTRNPDSAPTSLGRYVGEYWNASKTVRLVIILDNNGALILQFQGHSEDEFELKHLHDDVFSWFTSLHDIAERGRHIFDSLYYLIECQQGQGRQGLRWAHDSSETGELFEKTESEAPQEKVQDKMQTKNKTSSETKNETRNSATFDICRGQCYEVG